MYCTVDRPLSVATVESRLLAILRLLLISRSALIAENLFLRKQLALFQERKVRPRNDSVATRLTMLARFFHWRGADRVFVHSWLTFGQNCPRLKW